MSFADFGVLKKLNFLSVFIRTKTLLFFFGGHGGHGDADKTYIIPLGYALGDGIGDVFQEVARLTV